MRGIGLVIVVATAIAGCATIQDTRATTPRTSFVLPVSVTVARTCIVDGVQNARLMGVPYVPQVLPLGENGWSITHGGDARSVIDITPTEGGTLVEHRRNGPIVGDPFDNVVEQCRAQLS